MKLLIAAALLAAIAAPVDAAYVTRDQYGDITLQPFCITEVSARAVLDAAKENIPSVFEGRGDCQFAKPGIRYQVMQRSSGETQATNLRRVLILGDQGVNFEMWFFLGEDIEDADHE